MLDIERLKKLDPISKRMRIMDYMCKNIDQDIYYMFGLLNMYNVKNRGRWFWQKARFTGVLQDDFDNFNKYMDKFVRNFNSLDEASMTAYLNDAQKLMEKLIVGLETNMNVDRSTDTGNVKSYIDESMKNLIEQSFKSR